MDIISIVQLIAFIIIPILVLLISVLTGLKRNLFQAIAKLVMTLLSIVISVVLARCVTPVILNNIIPLLAAEEGAELIIMLQNSSVGHNLIGIASGIINPIIFVALFTVISILFAILYIIPKKLLSDKRMRARAAEINFSETADEQLETSQPVEAGTAKVWRRIGSVALSVFSTILVLAHFSLPVTYYPQIVADINRIEAVSVGSDDAISAVEDVADHPTITCYRLLNTPATYCLDSVTVRGGKTGSARATVISTFNILDSFSALQSGEMTAETFYALADLLESNQFIDTVLADVIHEMIANWEKGESWFGVEAPSLGDDTISPMLFGYLKDCDSVASALRLAGDAMMLQEVMLTEGFNLDAINAFLINASPESVRAIGEMLCTTIESNEELPAEITEALSVFTGEIVNEIVKIKLDESIAASDKAAILENEAAVVSTFYYLIENPEQVNPKELGQEISKSIVVANVIQNITENGKVQNPCGFADSVPQSFVDSVESGLEQGGVSKSSELYKSVTSFFGRG